MIIIYSSFLIGIVNA